MLDSQNTPNPFERKSDKLVETTGGSRTYLRQHIENITAFAYNILNPFGRQKRHVAPKSVRMRETYVAARTPRSATSPAQSAQH